MHPPSLDLDIQFKQKKRTTQHNDDIFQRKEENETLHKYGNIFMIQKHTRRNIIRNLQVFKRYIK
jgi:hypothetical protein